MYQGPLSTNNGLIHPKVISYFDTDKKFIR